MPAKRESLLLSSGGFIFLRLFVFFRSIITVDRMISSNTNGDDEPDDGPNDEQPKICGDSICPQILSSSIYNSDLYIFARTSDNTIAHRVLSDDREWESWVDLGKATGRFISQPWAVTWNVNGELPRLDVFAISSWERVVYNRWLSDSEDWDDNDWFGMGADAGSAISPCIPSRGTLDLWGTSQDTRAITHSWWIEDEDLSSDDSMITSEYGRFWTTEGRWRWEQPLRASRSAPSSVCRNSDVAYDFVYYSQNDVQLIHTWYIFGDEWRSRDLDHGDWIGDPVLVSPDPERWDFFGIQSNNELYHLDWTSTGGYSPMDNLGGNVISQPAILSVDRGVFDVVALGVNGTLQHLHFDGSRWSDDWEDLDIEAHSAPSSFIFKDQVHIAVVASDGHLMVWSREASVEEAWKGSLRSEDLEGDLSLEFLTTES